MTSKRPLQLVLLSAMILLVAHPALAQKSPRQGSQQAVTRSAEIEVIESASQGGKQNKATLMIALVSDGGPSSLAAHIAGADYRIVIYRQDTQPTGPITKLSIKSTQRSGGNTILDVDARAVTPLGKRIVVSQVRNPDGSQFEVAITVR